MIRRQIWSKKRIQPNRAVTIWLRAAIFLATILNLPANLKAQLALGIATGINRNYLKAYNSTSLPFTYYDNDYSFAAKVILQYQVGKYVTLGLEPTFLGRAYSIKRNDYYEGVYQTIRNNYIQLPLMLTGMLHYRRFLIGANVGIYGAYWVNSVEKGMIPNLSNLSLLDGNVANVFQNMLPFSYRDDRPLDKKLDRRGEFGWIVGMNFQYQFNRRMAMFVTPSYSYAVTGQVQDRTGQMEQRYNETLGIFVGILLKTTTFD